MSVVGVCVCVSGIIRDVCEFSGLFWVVVLELLSWRECVGRVRKG